MLDHRPTLAATDSPRKPGRDDPDPRPSAPPPPDVPDRSDPPEPVNFPTPPDAGERHQAQRPSPTRHEDLLNAIAMREDEAVRLRHFTVLDTLIRLKCRIRSMSAQRTRSGPIEYAPSHWLADMRSSMGWKQRA